MGKGRPKGAVNKSTVLAKTAIAAVAEGLGGVQRMIAWAREDEANERVFWSSIYTKLIPVQTELTGADGGPIQTESVSMQEVVARFAALTGASETEALRALAATPVETPTAH